MLAAAQALLWVCAGRPPDPVAHQDACKIIRHQKGMSDLLGGQESKHRLHWE